MGKKETIAYYDGMATGLNATLSILRLLLDNNPGFFGKKKRERNITMSINTVNDMLYNLEQQLSAI